MIDLQRARDRLRGGAPRRFVALHAFGFALAATIFAFDLVVPHGVAAAIPYTLLVLLSLREPGPGLTWFAAISVSLLTIAGAFLPSLPSAELWKLTANRLLTLFVIWTTAILCAMHKRDLARIERERRAAQRSDELANLGEMAAGIAHELGTPLAALQGRIEMLEQRLQSTSVDSDELRRSVRTLGQLGDRMTRIVRTVRSLARDAAGDPFEDVALAQLIRDVLVLAEERLRTFDVGVRLGPVAEDVRIECREAQISQVLLNLIGNAADAVRDLRERWIQLDVRESRHAVEIAVTDSGAGIPAAIRDRIMAPFFTTKPPGQGTGLGLSISRALVEGHAGTLAVDPRSPHTRFVLSLPRRQAGAPPE
jgi:C4-dicarboxylate-specific signal transduction histidine kinase